LILTNDGDFGNSLSHPSFDVDKKYFVRAEGVLDNSSLFKIEKGIVIEDKKTSPAKISAVKTVGGNTEFFLTIHEGRKRQIRRMLEKVGYKVIYLKRTEQGKYKLGNLKTGEYKTFEK
jgi:23S rRNA pseudouridine2605 synthase